MYEPSYDALIARARRAELSQLARLEDRAPYGLSVTELRRLGKLRRRYGRR